MKNYGYNPPGLPTARMANIDVWVIVLDNVLLNIQMMMFKEGDASSFESRLLSARCCSVICREGTS